jgi:N-acetylglucosamine kinase-like BadF-type ATPase
MSDSIAVIGVRTFSRPLLAGLDGGSTKTRLVVADSTGCVLGTAIGGSSNCGLVDAEKLTRNFDSLFRDVAHKIGTTSLDVVYIGSAGVYRPSDFATLESVIRRVTSVKLGTIQVDTDAMIGLTGGVCRDSGIVLIAGTGSACFGKHPNGDSWQTGGRECLVDDRGSAYRIALEGLIAAVHSADCRGPATTLKDRLFEVLGIKTLPEIVARLHYPEAGSAIVDKAYLAGLAPLVFSAAQAGDLVAASVIEDELNELVHMIDVVVRKLNWTDQDVPLVLIGSVANRPEVRRTIAFRLKKIHPGVEVVRPVLSPEGGALLLAAKLAGIQTGPRFIANVREGETTLGQN